jgi:hypothetical protein
MVDITNLKKQINDIEDEKTLDMLADHVHKCLKVARTTSSLRRQASGEIAFGKKVSFEGRRGMKITGTITKVNQKTCNVKTDMGNWRVAIGLLTVVE